MDCSGENRKLEGQSLFIFYFFYYYFFVLRFFATMIKQIFHFYNTIIQLWIRMRIDGIDRDSLVMVLVEIEMYARMKKTLARSHHFNESEKFGSINLV
jgi:hypothetical protein